MDRGGMTALMCFATVLLAAICFAITWQVRRSTYENREFADEVNEEDKLTKLLNSDMTDQPWVDHKEELIAEEKARLAAADNWKNKAAPVGGLCCSTRRDAHAGFLNTVKGILADDDLNKNLDDKSYNNKFDEGVDKANKV